MSYAPESLPYERDPEAIYEASFGQIEKLAEMQTVSVLMRPLMTRLVHTCGDPQIVDDVRASPGIVPAVRSALDQGANIYCDTATVRAGIMRRLLPTECELRCAIAAERTREVASSRGTTRSAAQFDIWGSDLAEQVVVIGNAPTALFRLLEIVDAKIARPAAIIAFPVGFVGAAEAKAELDANSRGIPYVTLLGRRGGSALAQAALNALAGGLNR